MIEGMAKKPGKVFISYGEADRVPARDVADYLKRSGIPVWFDEWDLLPGSDWMGEIKTALDSARALVVFISPEAVKLRSVAREIEYALGARHLSGRLISVIVRPARRIPWILKTLPQVRYEDPRQTAAQIVELLKQPAHVPQAKRTA